MATSFISYDLMASGQHYERVHKAIKDLGSMGAHRIIAVLCVEF